MAPVSDVASAPRRIGRASAAAVLVLAVVTIGAPGSTASPSARLHAAQDQLSQLTDRITTEEAHARSLEDHLAELNARIADARSRMAGIDAQLSTTRREMAAASAKVRSLQRRLDAIAQALFMQGAGSMQASIVSQLLGTSSIGDFADLFTYGQAIGRSDVDLGDRIANLKVQLGFKADELARLRSEQVQLVAELSAQRATEAQAIAEERSALATLEHTKTQIVELIAHLHQEIRAEALASVGTAFQGPGHVSYGAWAGTFLRTIGAPGCRSNLVAIVAWQYSEFTQAAWNPLADTLPMPGSTAFNSVGVQNYASLSQGLEAVRHTLTNGPALVYPAIVTRLRGCADAMTTAQAINASAWCRGCADGHYVTGVIAKVEANYELYAAL
jgi:predicted  nucleic acid-binding Zn-ribbon protein